jgi:hypothetical protein
MSRRSVAAGVAIWFCTAAPPVLAQLTYVGAPVRGVVVDADTGAPLPGVHVVERWQWMQRGDSWHGSDYGYDDRATRIVETSTSADGGYRFQGWGPELHVGGRMSDFDDPRLLFFKSGYEPAQVFNDAGQERYTGWADGYDELSGNGRHNESGRRASQWDGRTIRLKRFHGACTDYARSLREFAQSDVGGRSSDRYPGLLANNVSMWQRIPAMLAALELTRGAMGRDAPPSLLPPALTFTGRVVSAVPGVTMRMVIVGSVRWPLKSTRSPAAIGGPRFVVEQGFGPLSLVVSPWQANGVDIPAGWEIDRDVPPIVSIYHSEASFARLTGVAWSPTDSTLPMRPLPDTAQARAEELRAWRRDLDAVAADPAILNRGDFLASGPLVDIFQRTCRSLPESLQAGLCFAPDSTQARMLEQRDARVAQADAPYRVASKGRTTLLRGWENQFGESDHQPGLTRDCITTPVVPPTPRPAEPATARVAPGSVSSLQGGAMRTPSIVPNLTASAPARAP